MNKQKSYDQTKQKKAKRKHTMKQISLTPLRLITLEDQSIRHLLKDFLRNSNQRESRVLVRISANWCSVGIKSRENIFFNKIPNEMMTNFNVFSTIMKNMILWDIYSTTIVKVYVYGLLLNFIVFQHLLHPQELCTTTSSRNIFNFGSR